MSLKHSAGLQTHWPRPPHHSSRYKHRESPTRERRTAKINKLFLFRGKNHPSPDDSTWTWVFLFLKKMFGYLWASWPRRFSHVSTKFHYSSKSNFFPWVKGVLWLIPLWSLLRFTSLYHGQKNYLKSLFLVYFFSPLRIFWNRLLSYKVLKAKIKVLRY